jgi:hypothetical protein
MTDITTGGMDLSGGGVDLSAPSTAPSMEPAPTSTPMPPTPQLAAPAPASQNAPQQQGGMIQPPSNTPPPGRPVAYQSSVPNADPLGQASDLLQQRLARAQNVANNPIAWLFDPAGARAARDFTMQAPLQLDAIAKQRQAEIDNQNDARAVGYNNAPLTVTPQGINAFLLQQYRTGDPMQSMNAARVMNARGLGHLVDAYAPEAFDNTRKRVDAVREGVDALNDAGHNQVAYAAARQKLVEMAGGEEGTIQGIPVSQVPKQVEQWQAVSGGVTAQVAQFQQAYQRQWQQYANLSNFSTPLKKDESDDYVSANFRMGDGLTSMPVHAVRRADGTVAATLGPGSNNPVGNFGEVAGRKPGADRFNWYGTEQQEATKKLMDNPLTKYAITESELAGKMMRLVSSKDFASNSNELALFRDIMGAYGRNVPGSAAAGSVGLSKLSDAQRSQVENWLHTVKNNWASIKSALDSGKPLPRDAQSAIDGMRQFAAWAVGDARAEVAKNAGALVDQLGYYGAFKEQMQFDGLDGQQLDRDAVFSAIKPLYDAARWKSVQAIMSHPFTIRQVDGARIIAPVGYRAMGFYPGRQLPNYQPPASEATAPAASAGGGVSGSPAPSPATPPNAPGPLPSGPGGAGGGGSQPSPPPTNPGAPPQPNSPTGQMTQGMFDAVSGGTPQNTGEPDTGGSPRKAEGAIGAAVKNAGPVAASFLPFPASTAAGAIAGASGQALENNAEGRPWLQGTGGAAVEGGAIGSMPGGTGLAATAGRVGLGGVAGAAGAIANGGDAADAIAGGATGMAAAVGGEAFGKALGMGFHKIWTRYNEATKTALMKDAEIIATQEPKTAGADGKMQPNTAYENAEQRIKDAGQDPETMAYAYNVTKGDSTPSKAAAQVNAPVAREQAAIGKGYQDVRDDIAAGGSHIIGLKGGGAAALPDGPVSLVASKAVPAKLGDFAAHVEGMIKAPTQSLEGRWDNLVAARSEALEHERTALGSTSDTKGLTAKGFRAIADSVRTYQERMLTQTLGPDAAKSIIGRMQVLDKRYALLMGATKDGDIVGTIQKGGAKGEAARKYFDSLASDDPVAKRMLGVALRMKNGRLAPADEQFLQDNVEAEMLHALAGPHVSLAVRGARLAMRIADYATHRGAGAPVKFVDLMRGPSTNALRAPAAAAGATAGANGLAPFITSGLNDTGGGAGATP